MARVISGAIYPMSADGGPVASEACSSIDPAGAWRLPTSAELETLLDVGEFSGLYLDRAFSCPGNNSCTVWSSTPDSVNPDYGRWTVDFFTGRSQIQNVGFGAQVLCVGSGL